MRPSPGEDAAPPGFPEATESLTAGAGTTVSTEVTGLDSGTTHEYRAVASAGEVTDEGGVRSFDTDESGGGCFLTTATADDARTLDALRRFRDESMAATPLGRGLVGLYYRVSPPSPARSHATPGVGPRRPSGGSSGAVEPSRSDRPGRPRACRASCSAVCSRRCTSSDS